MTKNPFFAVLVLLMLAVVMIPASPVKAWEYQDGTPRDTKYEEFGPRADKILIKLYSSDMAEFEGLAAGEIDITDWDLTKSYYDLFRSDQVNPATGLPYNQTINVVSYGDEFGIFLLDINNNNNQFLGNPPNPRYTNPVYPNPCSVVEMRQAIAHLCDRAQLDTIMGAGIYAPLYTTHGPSYGAYSHPEIKPGGALEALTYPYNRTAAEAKLDAGHFPIGADGWRYWDLPPYNPSGPRGPEDLDLKLKFPLRVDHQPRRDFGLFLKDELEAVKVHVLVIFGSCAGGTIQFWANKDFHLYTGGWGLGVDPDHVILWNWDFYWHPGRPYNYAGINDPDLNDYSYGVMYADTAAEALTNCLLFQERFAEIAAGVPLFSYRGNKGMSRCYTGGTAGVPAGDAEDIYRGDLWEGAVNVGGFGIDSFFGFLNMHPQGHERGDGEMTIRYGFPVSHLWAFNPVHSEFLWDWKVLALQLDSLLRRDPYNVASLKPWLASSYETGTYTHPVYGTCTKIRFTLRPDATWHDGTPITVADVYFTFVELDDILRARGLPPPWWISNVANILSFSILDPYNFEVLLDLKAVFAAGWIGENLILPAHIWKPIAETGDVGGTTPDPNCILSGPYRFGEYVGGSHILLYANHPGSTVTTAWPGSTLVTSPLGYFRWLPVQATIKYDADWRHKFDAGSRDIDATINNPNMTANTVDYSVRHIYPDATTLDFGAAGVLLAGGDPHTTTQTINFGYGMHSDHVDIVLPFGTTVTCPLTGKPVTQIPTPFGPILSHYCTYKAWVTIKEDIAGSTLYDYIGLPTYPYKSQLPTPDFKVDVKDIAVAGKAFGSIPGHERWNTVADINGDYKIDIRDIATIAKKFGWTG